MPPLNLISLLFLRPLRLVLPSTDARRIRIIVLKATHAPFVALIWVYERCAQMWKQASPVKTTTKSPRPLSGQVGGDVLMTPSRPMPKPMRHPDGSSKHDRGRSASTNAESSELLALVQSLSAKVDDLAAMVAGQQAA